MKTLATSLILSLALVGVGAQASSLSEPDNTPFQGVYGQVDNAPSRGQVQAELHQAKAAGQVALGDTDNVPFQAAADSGVSRAQVAADVDADAGSVAFGDIDNTPFQGV